MKLSKYIEVSDTFGKHGHRILFSIKTARAILINNDTYAKIYNHEFHLLSDSTFNNLITIGIIIDDAVNELHEFISDSKKYIDNNRTLYEVIQPTADCQFGCAYCGQTHRKKSLDDSFINNIVERITQKLDLNDYRSLSIGWFGGEPLMAISKIEKLTHRLKEITDKKGISYTASITTNGLNLTKTTFIRLIDCGIKEIDITLDGYAIGHDKRRPLKNGFGISTYDIIISNLRKISVLEEFEKNNIRLIIRSNIDRSNYHDCKLLAEDLINNGLREKIHSFYLAPIHSWGNDAHKDSLDIETFAQLESGFMIYLSKKQFKIGVLPISPKKQVCMSLSKDGEVYDAIGNVFNCTEIPYVDAYENKDYLIHSFTSGPTHFERSFKNWYNEIAQGAFPCTNCKILPICGGACPKAWHEGNPPCPSIKYNLKDRLLIFAHQTFYNR